MYVQANAQAEVKTVEAREVLAKDAKEAFADLRFLDNAELALIGGGGAHGGNFF